MKFCIVGTGRCGTSLLRRIFNQHPQLFVFGETHWIPKMYEFFGTAEADRNTLIEIVQHTYHETGNLVTPLDDQILKNLQKIPDTCTVQEFCDALATLFAERDNKQYWADKTPDYGPHMYLLSQLWPKCKFVHIIRNGLETAVSMSHHHGFQWMVATGEQWWVPASFNRYYQSAPKTDKPFESFIDLWYRRLQRIRNEADRIQSGNYLEIKFDQLMGHPTQTLETIANFVGLNVENNWLSTTASAVDPSHVKSKTTHLNSLELSPSVQLLLEELGYIGTR